MIDLLLPRTDGGVLAQAIVVAVVSGTALVIVRRNREVTLLVPECRSGVTGCSTVEASAAPSSTPATSESLWRWVTVGAACAVFVLGAVVLEVVAGGAANSASPRWAWLFPLAWPRAARVAWWCTVAVAAGAFRLAMLRLGIRQHPVVIVGSVLPFVVFAGGIAAGASWSTWH